MRAVTAFLPLVAVLTLAPPSAGQTPAGLAPRQTLQRIAESLDRRDVGAARALLEPALRAYPADPTLHNLAGVIEAQAGAVDAAEDHFKTAIRLEPRSPAAYENLGRLYQERAGADKATRAKAIAAPWR